MTVTLPPGRTVAEVVEFAILTVLNGSTAEETERLLSVEFRFSTEDAWVARERTFGGLFRAGTRNAENCPSPVKDPVAWESYQRGIREPSLVARIYPGMFLGL